MTKKSFIVYLLCLIGIFLYEERIDAYSLDVHKEITKRTIDQNVEHLNKSINDCTGFSKGVEESINKKLVKEWIEDGSYYEDLNWTLLNNPLCSHFYNPLTNMSGVGNIWPSAYAWANASNNSWSWKAARDKFHEGLTLKTKDERGKALAKAFEALGHMVHLVQDMAVPAHTRGKLHISEPYEGYTNKNIAQLNYSLFPFTGDTTSVSSGAPRQFWDTDTYNGKNPSASSNIGLAEYTNANFVSDANFLSDNTIFKDFSYPKYSAENYQMYDVDYSPDEKRIYLRKKGDGETIEHFATAGPLYKHLDFDPVLQRDELKLDPECHEDYAQKLIPRAVGYSAGLLDYFFRGEMDMEKDKDNPDQYSIKNLSSESMSGDLKLLYDDTSGNRQEVPGGSWAGSAIKPRCKKSGVTFTAPPDAEEPGKYILVLDKGKIGEEDGAVAGKVIDINTIQTSSNTLTITGSDTPSDGSCYTANGGIEPYKWSISKGTIDENGCITVTGQCGTATVSVKDYCEDTVAKNLKLPDSLEITGPDAGKCYTTTGTEPYTWDITKGTIDENGCVTGLCGTATISVTDANNCAGEKELNIPAETLTITGSDTTTKNSIKQYTASGCSSGLEWTVSGKGATISSTGLLTTGSTACGSLAVTATCAGCGTSATQDVRVTDAGQWVLIGGEPYCRPSFKNVNGVIRYCTGSDCGSYVCPGAEGELFIEGNRRFYISHACIYLFGNLEGGSLYQDCVPAGTKGCSCPYPSAPYHTIETVWIAYAHEWVCP